MLAIFTVTTASIFSSKANTSCYYVVNCYIHETLPTTHRETKFMRVTHDRGWIAM